MFRVYARYLVRTEYIQAIPTPFALVLLGRNSTPPHTLVVVECISLCAAVRIGLFYGRFRKKDRKLGNVLSTFLYSKIGLLDSKYVV